VHELPEGWRYVTDSAPIHSILLNLSIVGLFGMPYSVLMPSSRGPRPGQPRPADAFASDTEVPAVQIRGHEAEGNLAFLAQHCLSTETAANS
jgi:hypothetical protein